MGLECQARQEQLALASKVEAPMGRGSVAAPLLAHHTKLRSPGFLGHRPGEPSIAAVSPAERCPPCDPEWKARS